jgi:hypothetical protein
MPAVDAGADVARPAADGAGQPDAAGQRDAAQASDSGAPDATGDADDDASTDAAPPADSWTNYGDGCAPGEPTDADKPICAYMVPLTCGHATPPNYIGGCELGAECTTVCTDPTKPIFGCYVWGVPPCADPDAGPDAAVVVYCETCPGAGRRPAGLSRVRRRCAADPVADYLARAAHLEAASVTAFERIRDALAHHRAPRELVAAAERAREDEVRHARAVSALATASGGRAPRVRVRAKARATKLDVALENATEGCVRETFGALVANVQARRAHAPDLRREMARIAADETEHAALSWAIAAWVEPRLSAAARRRVARARRRAVAELAAELRADVGPRVSRELGVPRPPEMRCLLEGLDRLLWRAPAA